MLIETLLTFLSAAAPQTPPAAFVAPASLLASAPSPGYQPDKRAVDNWRIESALSLAMSPLAAARRAAALDAGEPARCVKLNNYWCIKRAGWTGEIAADADGHVAFASAEEGAAVAALLLRRYYVDYKRHTARAIVERWAPPQCGPMIGVARPGPVASRAGLARMLPQRVAPMGLAPRGLQNTLRARWLAAHGRGGFAGFGGRASRTPATAVDLMPAPSIMEGVAEAPRPRRAAGRRAEEVAAPLAPSLPFGGVVSCAGELTRIANYADHVAEGVTARPIDDLALFDIKGRPTENLAKVMANMAAVEIGPDRPRMSLITAAVAQLRRMLEEPPKEAPPADAAPPVAER